jgi:hypothetical protein
MTESKVYAKFKKWVQHSSKDRIDRIENIMIEGMFDVNYCLEGVEGWIENKVCKEPKRSTTPLLKSQHKVSQAQKNWALRQVQADGNCFFLLATDKRWLLIDGEHGDDINEMTVNQLIAMAHWQAELPIQKEQWQSLRQSLIYTK